MNNTKTIQTYELEVFIHKNLLLKILFLLGLFFLIVYIPFDWCIEYFWGWETFNDWRFPLMKKLRIFAMISLPLGFIFKEVAILIFKKKLIISIENNEINIQKIKQNTYIFTLDITKPFIIKLKERRLLKSTHRTYIIEFKNQQGNVLILVCPNKIIKMSENFISAQKYLKNKLKDNTQESKFSIHKKIERKTIIIKKKSNEKK